MSTFTPRIPAERILVIMPNWLGDAVMATPFLRALRNLYPEARIGAAARPVAAPVLSGLSFINDVFLLDRRNRRASLRWIRSQKFDLGILLPNSFRAAWLLSKSRVPQRIGYARDYRSFLLTERLLPMHRTPEQRAADRQKSIAIRAISRDLRRPAHAAVGSPYQPVPTIDYYLELAAHLGGDVSDKSMQLAITPQEQHEADAALQLAGIGPQDNLVVMVPGANYGASKCWLPERFAQVADRIMDRPERGGNFGAHVVLATSPREMPIAKAILTASMLCPDGGGVGRLHATARMNDAKGLSIGALKALVKRARLMVCNDTGPRHFAAAFNVPAVTLFGPTNPIWAETYAAHERIVRVNVPCSPCQLKVCPIDHRCMNDLTVEMVMDGVRELWPVRASAAEKAQDVPDIDPRDFA